jgi:hypothetical protein
MCGIQRTYGIFVRGEGMGEFGRRSKNDILTTTLSAVM